MSRPVNVLIDSKSLIEGDRPDEQGPDARSRILLI
jgi:hypothetical protein